MNVKDVLLGLLLQSIKLVL